MEYARAKESVQSVNRCMMYRRRNVFVGMMAYTTSFWRTFFCLGFRVRTSAKSHG